MKLISKRTVAVEQSPYCLSYVGFAVRLPVKQGIYSLPRPNQPAIQWVQWRERGTEDDPSLTSSSEINPLNTKRRLL